MLVEVKLELVELVELVIIAARLVAIAAGRRRGEDGSLGGCDGVVMESVVRRQAKQSNAAKKKPQNCMRTRDGKLVICGSKIASSHTAYL